jgi:hypothetical protein
VNDDEEDDDQGFPNLDDNLQNADGIDLPDFKGLHDAVNPEYVMSNAGTNPEYAVSNCAMSNAGTNFSKNINVKSGANSMVTGNGMISRGASMSLGGSENASENGEDHHIHGENGDTNGDAHDNGDQIHQGDNCHDNGDDVNDRDDRNDLERQIEAKLNAKLAAAVSQKLRLEAELGAREIEDESPQKAKTAKRKEEKENKNKEEENHMKYHLDSADSLGNLAGQIANLSDSMLQKSLGESVLQNSVFGGGASSLEQSLGGKIFRESQKSKENFDSGREPNSDEEDDAILREHFSGKGRDAEDAKEEAKESKESKPSKTSDSSDPKKVNKPPAKKRSSSRKNSAKRSRSRKNSAKSAVDPEPMDATDPVLKAVDDECAPILMADPSGLSEEDEEEDGR